jgi:hypothetical protein
MDGSPMDHSLRASDMMTVRCKIDMYLVSDA